MVKDFQEMIKDFIKDFLVCITIRHFSCQIIFFRVNITSIITAVKRVLAFEPISNCATSIKREKLYEATIVYSSVKTRERFFVLNQNTEI